MWLELCITRIKCGVEECRYRYHMAEVPNGLLMVTAGAQLCNSGEKASITDNTEWEGKKSK